MLCPLHGRAKPSNGRIAATEGKGKDKAAVAVGN